MSVVIMKEKKGDHRAHGRDDLKRPVVFPKIKKFGFVIRNNLRVLGIGIMNFSNILEKI